MQIFEKIEEKTTTNKLVSMTCDICGKDLQANFIEEQECFNIVHYGGYGSIFGDGSIVAVDICQQCFKDKFGEYIRYISEEDLTV
jgi:hypothetical protein